MSNTLVKLLFILTVSLYADRLNAQRKAVYSNQLKVSPLRLIDPVHSGIEIAYEKRYAGNYSTQLSIGYFIRTIFNGVYKNYNGYRVGLEEKYFLPGALTLYLSAEAVHQKNSFSTVDWFVHDSSGSAPSFQYADSIKITRQSTILNFKAGRQLMINKFVTDVSIGCGVRFRKVLHEEKIYPGDELVSPRHPNLHYSANREKDDAAFNFPWNIRIGFRF